MRRERCYGEIGGVRLVLSIDTMGGGWNAVMSLARGLAGHGFDLTLALLGPTPTPAQQAEINAASGLRSIAAHDNPARTTDSFSDIQTAGQALARLVNVLAPDAVVLHNPMLAAFGPFCAPVVVTPDCRDLIVAGRTHQAPGHEWRARLLRSGYQSAAAIVTASYADAGDILDAHRVRRPPRVIRRAFTPILPDDPSIDLQPYVLAVHQATDGRENLATLNEAAFLCASPIMLAGLKAGQVRDTGHMWALGDLTPGQTQRWLAGARVFVSAAHGDTDGELVWRAAEAGCAMVLAAASDYCELWADAASFAADGDDIGLARAINALMLDGDMRSELAGIARQRVAAWTRDQAIAEWATFLGDIAAIPLSRNHAA